MGKNETPIAYSVTFDTQNVDDTSNLVVKKVIAPATTVDSLPDQPTKTGYYFAGWYTEINGGGSEFTISTTVKSDLTVYAKWSVATVYKVSYKIDENTTYIEQSVIAPSTTVGSLPTDPTKTNYYFGGWCTEVEDGFSEFNEKTVVASDITVFAIWSSTPVHKVIYKLDENTKFAQKYVIYPETTVVTHPENPVKDGYYFAGWFTEINGGGTELTTSSAVTIDITVYPKWSVSITFKVTFEFDDYTIFTEKSVTSPETTVVKLPDPPVKSGYTFAGWYTLTHGFGTEFTEDTVVNRNILVFAKWLVKGSKYTVGDIGPSGIGIVFYTSDEGLHGFEVAPVCWQGGNTSPCVAWSNVNGLYDLVGVSAQGTAVGTGLSNTNAIIAQSGHTTSAAKLCKDYRGGGKSDWFLPSIDELNLVYENLRKYKNEIYDLSATDPNFFYINTGDGVFRTESYWSSTEGTYYNAQYTNYNGYSAAWYHVFAEPGNTYPGYDDSSTHMGIKMFSEFHVRPVRSF